MPHVIAELTIVPLGTATPSLSAYVAEVERTLRQVAGLKVLLTPMATVLEGELDLVLQTVRRVHEIPFAAGAQRVSTRLSIDDRRDKPLTMTGKLEAVEEKLR
jgi:uncharacterized protein (TIGR00106 family)